MIWNEIVKDGVASESLDVILQDVLPGCIGVNEQGEYRPGCVIEELILTAQGEQGEPNVEVIARSFRDQGHIIESTVSCKACHGACVVIRDVTINNLEVVATDLSD